ncbi:hypothetical protein [Desulfobacter curvatus]|uniref:hypothetical protein n=1 Tax=Desulfobacter curvatus TaxID=2290 RepID=UPI00036875B1|nr:hypothetical protein [Desulfobacter curvatus]
MTHTFKKKRHYRELYHRILAFYKAGLNYPGTFIVLGIRNIDVLYEYYNLYAIAEIFRQKFGNSDLQLGENKILYFTFSSNQETYRVYYQLRINRKNFPSTYPWIKLFANSNLSKFFCPDIVIEKEEDGEFRYAILDAKYSSKYWVTGTTFYTIVGKYNFSISFRDEPYKKVDYLYLLYPDDGPSDILTKDKGYYPEMGAIPSIPSNVKPLITTILHILKGWEK